MIKVPTVAKNKLVVFDSVNGSCDSGEDENAGLWMKSGEKNQRRIKLEAYQEKSFLVKLQINPYKAIKT